MLKSSSVVSTWALCLVIASTTAAFGAESKIERLTKALKHRDPIVRLHAAADLGDLGRAASPAIRALMEALKDEHTMVRFYAADALGKIGTLAQGRAKAKAD